MKLYLETLNGISGDMTVGALLDLGADKAVLMDVLESMPVQGFHIQISRVKKAGLDVCDFAVVLDENYENHDHDMEYLHGHEHSHHNENQAGQHDKHDHLQEHEHPHRHIHGHAHRNLADILEIIRHTRMTEHARSIAIRIFEILARAEAKAHGRDIEQIHFHEVGAVDSIVDIVAAAVCLDNLDVEDVIIPELWEGKGTVRCQHGIIPIPVPAVVNIAQAYGLPFHITEVKGELVTPTGAAIAAAVRTLGTLPEQFVIRRIGMGAGKRNYERPSILRAMLIENTDRKDEDCIYKLETNIDDCTGEALGYVMQRLFDAGARDVHYIPVWMKKNRPAYELNVICAKEDIDKLEQIIFEETTTIGIRRMKMERTVLDRKIRTVHTPLGEARVKVCQLHTGSRNYPEYGSVVELCKEHQLSYQDAWRLIQKAAEEEQNDKL